MRDKFKEQVESKGYALVLVKDALVDQSIKDKDKELYKTKFKFIRCNISIATKTGYRDGKSFDEKRKMIR